MKNLCKYEKKNILYFKMSLEVTFNQDPINESV